MEPKRPIFKEVRAGAAAGSSGARPRAEIDTACDVIDAAQLGWNLTDDRGDVVAWRQWIVLLEQTLRSHYVSLALTGATTWSGRIDIVLALYEHEARLFQEIEARVLRLASDPATDAALRAAAIHSSQEFEALVARAVAESRQQSRAAADYLRRNTNAARVQFRCTDACGQLVGIARTGRGFD